MLHAIEGNTQLLDGGAMFGNAPKAMWSQWCPPDSLNRIPLACRSLLVQEGGKNYLFEAGVGAFFEPKMKERFGIQESEHLLIKNLAAIGIQPEDIDYVILSHLHFDHAGGILSAYGDGPTRLAFPRAQFYTGKRQWERACHPHPRDKASYIPAIQELLAASHRLTLIDDDGKSNLPSWLGFEWSEGHTPGLMLSRLQPGSEDIWFCSDLVPGTAWLHTSISMGYDRFPERVIDEKTSYLARALGVGAELFFTHDATLPRGRLGQDAKGKYIINS